MQRRCQECRVFYDKKLGDCPSCGASPYPPNVALGSEQWRNNLRKQAHHAKLYG